MAHKYVLSLFQHVPAFVPLNHSGFYRAPSKKLALNDNIRDL